ncbi:hypothetical protein N7522_002852 [Penicillium canescens]|uniref:Uncharacterized protein n=1 Tax=Penicillium canescens TaxID=5083 RepID=A0AAD6ND99_PENCN|nr:uncharacterized protein N7446_007094 [Penicillium canescens]KAJ6012497.1 hypothetical protein N7522_002852 [Penicillium canescens]KAJ6049580.1 hypothetical protein N7444_006296 [Penicillium canescens]KAJ6052451.1 hypothetical protein N7460_002985 [Penicillium canescens]KAJ6062974.1 hypothetical protein N7446_007094 [Penicillium canescens]KAJ6182004.1 hypothetical protein N7485_000646 [Penicillium canescens]
MEPRRHNATRPAAKNWKCDECQSTFRRMDHMKRHVLTHHTAKKHVCSFCGSAFSRGDVLRRHWKSCKNRVGSGQAIPKPDRGGKHKWACDSCARLRKACSGELPCSECIHRGRACTYRRLHEEETPLPPISQLLSETREAEGPALGRNTSKASNSWDLGPATLYPSSTEVLRHKTALTQ